MRDWLRLVAVEKNEWAGIPLPIDDDQIPIVIEPNYPHAVALMALFQKPRPESNRVHRNTFWSHRLRCSVAIWEEDGKIHWGIDAFKKVTAEMCTLGASIAWGFEQEIRAQETLRELITPHAFHCYFMTGQFLESSKRSGIVYLFRKLRPTVAIKARGEEMIMLAALCMHPIAYYGGSWAGAMCPTDDVIAHLVLMRGDEAMFWRRSNQHSPDRPEAGI